jgi:aspartyl aminopeptidase
MLNPALKPALDLLTFIDSSPTPYHAVDVTARRLEAAGFNKLDPATSWKLASGARHYVTRGDGSIAAFIVGQANPSEAGFRIIGAHTDSPNLRLRPNPQNSKGDYGQLDVEPYGGLLLHTWLDRDLSVAGRVAITDSEAPGGFHMTLIDLKEPLLRIPSLAIHLSPGLREDGLKLNAESHSSPLFTMKDGPAFMSVVATALSEAEGSTVTEDQILAFDLMTYDTQPSALSGPNKEFIHAPRLDNLASCHAALVALIAAAEEKTADFTRLVVFYDHEEVGSHSASGAAGPFLPDLCAAIVSGTGGSSDELRHAVLHSTMLSVDMAHAVHPNYGAVHTGNHRPLLGAGPVIKSNPNQAYATAAPGAALVAACCRRADVVPQHFVARADMGCGSTIGPISATRLGIETVDLGNPMLSMHSCREMAASADVEPMIRILREYFLG